MPSDDILYLCELRAQLLARIPAAMKAGKAKQGDRQKGQGSIFDLIGLQGPQDALGDATEPQSIVYAADVKPLSVAELLAGEKKALGFYLSGHPMDFYTEILAAQTTCQIADVVNAGNGDELTLGGTISNVVIKNVSKSRSGLNRMAKFVLEDQTGPIPCVAWPEAFGEVEKDLKEDCVLLVTGKIDRRRDPAEFVVSKVVPVVLEAESDARPGE